MARAIHTAITAMLDQLHLAKRDDRGGIAGPVGWEAVGLFVAVAAGAILLARVTGVMEGLDFGQFGG